MADNNNAVWARPGSDVSNTLQNISVSDDSAISASSAGNAPANEAEIVAPKNDSADLVDRDRQADFFTSMSGVEKAEIEDNEMYAPTSLLEVPFNDTTHNLGYRIPKMRLSMTKSTKRKVIAFSSVLSAIAVAIVAVIILNNIFGFIPTVKQSPVMYIKNGNVYLTTSTGRFPEEMLFDGNIYQLSKNTNLIGFVPNSKDVLIASDYSNSNGTYSLYLHEDMEVSEQGTFIDSGIVGNYEYIFGGKGLLYLKSKGTNDLYMRMFSSDSSVQIERKIEMFGVLDDNKVVFITTSGGISTVELNSDGTFSVNELVKSAEALYVDSESTNAFYYIVKERNTESTVRTNNLYRYCDGETSKVAENADTIIAYSCADNWAYYSNTVTVSYGLFDFINDDCVEFDNELINSLFGYGQDTYRRDHIRTRLSSSTIEFDYTSIGYYADGVSNVIETNCTEIYAIDLNGEFVSCSKKGVPLSYNVNKSGLPAGTSAGIMYRSAEISDGTIKFSEVPNSVILSNDSTFITYIKNQVNSNFVKYTSRVTANGKKATVDTAKFADGTVAFSSDYSNFYYIKTVDMTVNSDDQVSTLEEGTVSSNARATSGNTDSTGDLMCLGISDSFIQPVAVDVERFELLSGGVIIYINTSGTAYVGAVAIAGRVSEIVVNQSRTAAAILCESSDVGCRLIVYKEGATKTMADNVHSVVFNDDESLSFIKDYDKVASTGDLYVSRKFGTPSRVDTGVSSIVKYSY